MAVRMTRSRQSLNERKNETKNEKTTKATKRASTIAKEKANTGKKRSAPTEAVKSEPSIKQESTPTKPPAKRAKTGKPRPDFEEGAKIASKIQADPDGAHSNTSSPSKQKTNAYNLTAGVSPYPSYTRPTPQECKKVTELLEAVHGKVDVPKSIPAPSLQSSGCGEVPSVLDALIRTRLSAATNNNNSSRAFRGLVEKFGTIKEGVGKGSVDWDNVRRAPVKDVFEAIKTGGLADVKSRDIQKILNMVYEENRAGQGNPKPSNKGKTVLSLDHLHSMESEEAFDKLINYPGVGPKTASCVLLFCMQRPSFAVDTHVFRLVSWLGWVPTESSVRRMAKEAKSKGERPPPPVSRNTSYAHLDVRIPDDLKYPLHYLFIRHGKTCPSCAAKKDSKIREAWGDKKCPLAALKSGRDVSSAGPKAESLESEIKEEEMSSSAEE